MKWLCSLALILSLPICAIENGAIGTRLKNCEIELEMLKNSISSQEQAREALEKEMSSLLRSTKETLTDSRDGSVQRQKAFDKTLEKLLADLKQLKTHSNELSNSVNDLSKSVTELRETQRHQGQSFKELEQALRALTMAMGGKGSSKSGSSGTYTVKNGDSLEKIAKSHGMTISELKELNQIKNATIHPGQELQVR
jgi:LysM repeat protein